MAAQGPDQEKLFLDDLVVGRRFFSGTHQLDEAQIKEFAAAYDPQPFHLDDTAAKATLFGGLAASGWHTAAITTKLLLQGGAPIAGGLIGAGGELNWLKPVRPGDVLRVAVEVLKVVPSRSKPHQGIVTLRCETLNQHDETVQVFTNKLVVPRRAAQGS